MEISRRDDPSTLDPTSAEVQAFDAQVEASEGLDGFCSSSRWVLPAARAFHPGEAVGFAQDEDGAALFIERPHESHGFVLHPLEATWGFASAVAGPKLEAFIARLARRMLHRAGEGPGEGLLLLPGLPEPLSFARRLARALRPGIRLLAGPCTGRARASLAGGMEGYLARRTPAFRRRLRRARVRAEGTGITFEAPGPQAGWPEIYRRIQAVEARSWKGREEVGIAEGPMQIFYDVMGARLRAEGGLRVLFARRDGEDLAYHFGVVHAGVYRGLQHAFVEAARSESLGNLTHLEMIARIIAEGVATYDLGQEIDYKHAWAEGGLVTRALYLVPS